MVVRARVAPVALLAVLGLLAAGCGGRQRGPASPAPDRERAAMDAPPGGAAVSSITEADVATMRVGRIEELLAGRVPGLTVHRLGNGDYTLRIRGRVSFTGSDEPLIVIDGMPIEMGGASRALASIDPRDVARIDVLKDAGATAAYGSRGGNGVILISTRRGR